MYSDSELFPHHFHSNSIIPGPLYQPMWWGTFQMCICAGTDTHLTHTPSTTPLLCTPPHPPYLHTTHHTQTHHVHTHTHIHHIHTSHTHASQRNTWHICTHLSFFKNKKVTMLYFAVLFSKLLFYVKYIRMIMWYSIISE